MKTADEAEKAITNLSGKDILERKVSVQLARKPEQTTPKAEGSPTEGGEDRKRASGRGRGGRGRGRGGRAARGGRTVRYIPPFLSLFDFYLTMTLGCCSWYH